MQDQEYRYLSTELKHLIIDTVLNANSGHLGMPLGMADIATVLFKDFLNFNPKEPTNPLRDRFVLSCGHGSSLLYSILYLCGYDISINDLKNFRQLNSKTPGHPEFNKNMGIEITTGPLGQGIANAVGMAIEQKKIEAILKNDINFKTYVFASDGDMMEGISHEALSFAGTNKLSNLIIFLDNNNITIDGPLSKSCTENYAERFNAYGFFVQTINGHDFDEIKKAISNSISSDKPSIIICNTIIGRGIEEWEGTSKIHGSIPPRDTLKNLNFDKPLNFEPSNLPKEDEDETEEDTETLFKNMAKTHEYHKYKTINSVNNWDDFFIQQDALNAWRNFYRKSLEKFSSLYYLEREIKKLQEDYSVADCIKSYYALDFIDEDDLYQTLSTKECFNRVLHLIKSDKLIGGSADLTSSNGTKSRYMQDFSSENYSGNYINYGIREHAMGAIINGINAGEVFRAFSGTFLSFSDYMRPSIRLAALMNVNSIFVFSHDSIFVGQDGPTHQPIEQLDSLRLIPNLNVWRPCDYQETLEAFKYILGSNSPSALILSRQKIKNSHQYTNIDSSLEIQYGGYIISDFSDKIENSNADVVNYSNAESFRTFNRKILLNNPHMTKIILVASGSEVHLCLEIKEFLSEFGIYARVVSIPCFEVFEKQSKEYKDKLLDHYNSLRVFIEASTGMCFDKHIKRRDKDFVINLESFGKSAPEKDLRNEFAFDPLSISNYIIQKSFL